MGPHGVRICNIGTLIAPQGKLTAQGKLLQQDTFYVTEHDSGVQSRPKERRVFLFEQIVIFSELLRKGSLTPGYMFKRSIKVRNRVGGAYSVWRSHRDVLTNFQYCEAALSCHRWTMFCGKHWHLVYSRSEAIKDQCLEVNHWVPIFTGQVFCHT